MFHRHRLLLAIPFTTLVTVSALPLIAQMTYRPTPNDTLHSLTVSTDRTITFRIYAPRADTVSIGGSDLPEQARRERMVKHENGVWEVTVGPVPPGEYRYQFIVDGLSVLDPRNPTISESNANSWSMVYVPGSEEMNLNTVDHGAVAEVTYYSSTLKSPRRMHVYTPHGYERGNDHYPVFYLLHGAFDTDDAWHTIGRAGYILDNLIAENKAVPMIVVMPAGHTSSSIFNAAGGLKMDEFVQDFLKDIKPYIEEHYRVIADRDHRAIAGLSMGGAQTLDIAIPHLEEYGYIGVYSSGLFELGPRFGRQQATASPTWEERNARYLDDGALKKGLHLFWFATGKDDFLVGITRSTVDLFKRHGFDVRYEETSGAHTWTNWRDYLIEFAPLLFH